MDGTLPSQRNSIADKQNESWYKDTYDYYIRLATSLKDTTLVSSCLNAANGIINMDTYNYVLKPFGNTIKDLAGSDVQATLPGELRNTDFITPIKEKNLGEYIELPYKFFVKVDNPDSILARDNKLKSEVGKLMQQAFINMLNQQQSQQTGEGSDVDSKPIPDIATFAKEFVKTWLDERATKGQHTLSLINDLTDFDVRRIQDFFYWWATEEFYTYRYIKNGEVFVESISPLDGYPVPNGNQFVEDFDAFVIKRRISWNQFLDKYGDEISEKDKTYVEELNKSYSSTGKLSTDVKFLNARYGKDFDASIGLGSSNVSFDTSSDSNSDIDEYITFWKTEVPIKLLTYENITGEILTVEVENDYEFDATLGDISIKQDHRQVVYVGQRFGARDKGLYLKPKPVEVQRYDKQSRTAKLPIGGKQGILDGIPRNPIPLRMVPYLAWDRFIYLQIERQIAKYKGSMMLMPKGLMNPDEAGSSQQKYFYMMADNTIMYDETLVDLQTVVQGFRIVDNRGLENYLKVLIDLRQDNKREAYDLANMNEERAGVAANSQTVGNAQQNIYRAKLGSTLMITMFNKALEHDHMADMEFSKFAWIEGKVGTYFDKATNTPITVEIDPIDHLNSDYGIFVRNSKAEESKFQAFRDLAFSASQNGDFDLASAAIMAESTPELDEKIKEFTKAKREFDQSQNDSKNDAIKYAADQQTANTQAQITSNEKIADVKADSASEVAYINAMGFNDETKGENTFTDADILANAKNAREERKLRLAETTQSDKNKLDNEKLKLVKRKSNSK